MLEPANGCEAEHDHDSHTKTKGPEILKNKVRTGWGWQILLRKNLREILIQKVHHKSTLQRSRPKSNFKTMITIAITVAKFHVILVTEAPNSSRTNDLYHIPSLPAIRLGLQKYMTEQA